MTHCSSSISVKLRLALLFTFVTWLWPPSILVMRHSSLRSDVCFLMVLSMSSKSPFPGWAPRPALPKLSRSWTVSFKENSFFDGTILLNVSLSILSRSGYTASRAWNSLDYFLSSNSSTLRGLGASLPWPPRFTLFALDTLVACMSTSSSTIFWTSFSPLSL